MQTETLAVLSIFTLASAITIFLILRRPYLYIRAGARSIKFQSYLVGAVLGPILLVIFGLITSTQALHGLQGTAGLDPAGILILFVSMVFMSIFLDITGFFEYAARLALRSAKGNPKRLFFSLYLTVSVLTIFTSNDIIILTFTPFIYYFTRNARLDPVPYLIAEFFAANTWSMMLYIGNPTNIVIATAYDITFTQYLAWMFLPTIAAGATNAALLYLIFRKKIDRPFAPHQDIDPASALTDRTGAILGVSLLALCIVALAVAPYIGFEMWPVALAFAIGLMIILVIRDSYMAMLRRITRWQNLAVGRTMQRIPWSIIPFVGALFITVEALRIYGITDLVGSNLQSLAGSGPFSIVFVYGISSALAANVLNNIPMTVASISVMRPLVGTPALLPAAFAVAIGSNLGANITPLGALAGIMWMSILSRRRFKITFAMFVRYGLMVTPVTLAVALGVLALQFTLA